MHAQRLTGCVWRRGWRPPPQGSTAATLSTRASASAAAGTRGGTFLALFFSFLRPFSPHACRRRSVTQRLFGQSAAHARTPRCPRPGSARTHFDASAVRRTLGYDAEMDSRRRRAVGTGGPDGPPLAAPVPHAAAAAADADVRPLLRATTFQHNQRLWAAFLPCLVVLAAFGGQLCVHPSLTRSRTCTHSLTHARTRPCLLTSAFSPWGGRARGARFVGVLSVGLLVAYALDMTGAREGCALAPVYVHHPPPTDDGHVRCRTLAAVWMTVAAVELVLVYHGFGLLAYAARLCVAFNHTPIHSERERERRASDTCGGPGPAAVRLSTSSSFTRLPRSLFSPVCASVCAQAKACVCVRVRVRVPC
jgi:hypothetical protein